MIKALTLLSIAALYSTLGIANSLPQALNVPGGVVKIRLGALDTPAPQVLFNNHRVLVTHDDQQWLALVGIPLETAQGQHAITLKTTEKTSSLPFNIAYKAYPAQYLTLQNKRMVNPNAEDVLRINRETQLINKAIGTWSEQAEVDTHFMPPVEGRLSGVFGSRRFFNKQAKNPHSGIDIAAPTGTPIKAPASGKVIGTGEYYYNGRCVFLDHGQGLISAYFHMTHIEVQPGQMVNQGDMLGTVGATGRVTGPHLHWNIYLNNTKVDPALFISDDIPRLEARNHK
ncbi:MAG: peptidoglycan DD-metalloendopeptidase family protein [Methylococcaceae bacterium]|nr:peptidoglycan DD-metalloendopeptidase family protein [Methylococcaceae bacterium]